jgi:hypothetical protein
MTRRAKIGLVMAVLFLLVNLGGAAFAAIGGELLHTGIHAGLLLLGVGLVWWLTSRHDAGRIWRWGSSASPRLSGELSDRLTHLEQSVDAVAVEVERIGEGQRFVTRLVTERGAAQAAGEGVAEPIGIPTQENAAPVRRS